MLFWSFFQISERKFDRTRKHIHRICLRVIANLRLKFGEKIRKFSFLFGISYFKVFILFHYMFLF